MLKFHPISVADVRKETSDSVSIAFDLTEEQKELFQFIPGQYLTFKMMIDGEEVRRSYSICSSPYSDEKIRVAVKKVENGKFSTFANEELKANTQLEAMPPMGNFCAQLDADNEKHYVAFAAGSGITPIMSIMKSVLIREPKSKFTLFYGNRNTASIIFREEIEDLKNIFINRLRINHILTKEDQGTDLLKGRITTEKCTQILDSFNELENANSFFLCGPEEMINSVKDVLQKRGVEEKKIHFELFNTTGKKESRDPSTVTQAEKDGLNSNIKIIIDNNETEFNLKADGLSILDAAIQEGIDVPFACKGAVCCTCKAKVQKGKVRMDMNYSLEKDELDDGYVLTCQAHPETDQVTVDFDS